MLFKNDFDTIASEANDKHSVPWAEACLKSNINNTPLTPFIHKHHLTGYHILMNGSKLMNSPGFTLKHPVIAAELLKEVFSNSIFKINLKYLILKLIYRLSMTSLRCIYFLNHCLIKCEIVKVTILYVQFIVNLILIFSVICYTI